MILAVTDTGELVRNDRYHHYAGGARHLAFDAMARILIGEDGPTDAEFVAKVTAYWGAVDRADLRQRIQDLETRDINDVKRFYGAMAPLVTSAAEESEVASAACTWLAGVTSTGVRLLATHFGQVAVQVPCAGAVATCPAISRRLSERLDKPAGRLNLMRARLEPVGGSALLALRQVGVQINKAIIESITQGTAST